MLARIVRHESQVILQDDERDHEADDRVGDLAPSATRIALATTPSETKPSTRAWLPSAISAGLCEPAPGAEADLRGDLVADEADHTGGGEQPQVGEVLRVDEPLDRLVQRDAGRDEDREHDDEPGELLAAVDRRKNAMPSGTAVSASPKLWIRSASSATEPESAKIAA